MEVIIWILFVFFIVLGFAGTILPGLPGLLMFVIAAGMVFFLIPGVLSMATLIAVCAGFLLTFVIDFAGTIMGAKWGGATKTGLIGAAVGGLIGLFFGLPGLLLGPLLGAFIGEFIFKRRSPELAMKAGLGAGLGLVVSTVLKLALSLFLVLLLIVDIFFIV